MKLSRDDEPINPLQAMFDGMSASWQKQRASTQMTLGELIKTLESVDSEREIVGLGQAHSYRGFYDDLAFEPDDTPQKVSDALVMLRECMGKVFTGYKGGEFLMGESTPIWASEYGSCGLRIMGFNQEADPIRLIVTPEDEEL